MTQEPGSLREAVERNAQAVMTGNIVQVMVDLTPEALAGMMQMAPQNGNLTMASMPDITGYEIEERGEEDEAQVVRVTFNSSAGQATLDAHWKQITGDWKIVKVGVVSIEPSAETG